jgi:hypothetical protein
MTDSKLYKVLTHFNKIEQNRLRKYIRSPYFNVNEALMRLYDVLCEHIQANGNAPTPLSKDAIWAISIGSGEPFNDVRFRKLGSDLLKLVEDFLAQERFENDPLQKANYLIEKVTEKKMSPLYNSSTRFTNELLKQQPYKTSSYYYHQYLIEKNYYDLNEGELNRTEKSNVENIITSLDRFYLAEKLKWYSTVLSRANLISHEYKLLFIDEIIEHINKYEYSEVPSIRIYYQSCLNQLKPDNEENYLELKELVSNHYHLFPVKDAEEIYFYLLNFCTKKLNQGNSIYLRNFLNVYQEMLSKNILPNNSVNPWLFKNAIIIALRLGEYEWVEKYIEEYSPKLPEDFRENAVRYNLALLYFYQKQHDKVIKQLQTVEFDDIAYSLNAKSILISTYYELDEDNVLLSLMDSFKTYLNRHKDIAPNRRALYFNMMKYVRKLLKINTGDKKAIEAFKKEMEEDRKVGIASEKWILEKLAELE